MRWGLAGFCGGWDCNKPKKCRSLWGEKQAEAPHQQPEPGVYGVSGQGAATVSGVQWPQGCPGWDRSQDGAEVERMPRQWTSQSQGYGKGCWCRTPRYNNMQGKDRRLLIFEEVRAGVEEKRASQMVGMWQQGAWVPKILDLGSLQHAAESIQPLHQRWRHQLAPSAQSRGTLEHILSCCPIALGKGRYRWRHAQFLKAVADSICSCGCKDSVNSGHCSSLSCLRAGNSLGAQCALGGPYGGG